MTTLADLRSYLEHAPRDPGPIPTGLDGWQNGDTVYCSRCVGRIIARGFHGIKWGAPLFNYTGDAVCPLCGVGVGR